MGNWASKKKKMISIDFNRWYTYGGVWPYLYRSKLWLTTVGFDFFFQVSFLSLWQFIQNEAGRPAGSLQMQTNEKFHNSTPITRKMAKFTFIHPHTFCNGRASRDAKNLLTKYVCEFARLFWINQAVETFTTCVIFCLFILSWLGYTLYRSRFV